MIQVVVDALVREFKTDLAPARFVGAVAGRVMDAGHDPVSMDTVIDVIVDERVSAVQSAVRSALTRWDAEGAAAWTGGTAPQSRERRTLIYSLLGIPGPAFEPLTTAFPIAGGPTVIAAPQPWEPWYVPERRAAQDFYWSAYRRLLEAKGWADHVVDGLDVATTAVVQRLADPTREEPYQSKGLVVGYVQSGKTANFTGVIGKAIDAGYRLVIVLTGTIELLRSQTQRRLDMELIGMQNIDEAEYANDEDWHAGRFLTHVLDPNHSNDAPAIRRLTGRVDDYKALAKGIGTLHYEFVDHSKPLYDPTNLHASNVRVAVVKKNSAVLKKLVADVGKIPTPLDQIPTLIIDDEADQASVNTQNPKNFAAGRIERTAINEQISRLLETLGRSQYVGYTATPFANVFVDPDDSVNIFPNDFIVSLDRPEKYMGGADFHDVDDLDEGVEKTPANSNEKAFVRDLRAQCDEDREAERLRALDSFVLAGALKLFREHHGVPGSFRHHTMLVHESVKQQEHAALAQDFEALWKSAGYSQPHGLERLEELWDSDFRVVSESRSEPGVLSPGGFGELEEFIGAAADRIGAGISPVIVVNGSADKDYAQESLNFDEQAVWKILVGGTKLSRGFTVEGLTTTYYTRRTAQSDTLMQMGRWFGFRPGYRDLVRLFIGREVPGPGGVLVDMYAAFEAIVGDEEEFRSELARFKGLNEAGEPMVTPRDVPPMVFQRLPWLKPTATNKMYNAELSYRSVGGQSFSFTMQGPRGEGTHNAAHFAAVRPLLDSLSESGQFAFIDKDQKSRTFEARYGIVPADSVLEAITQFVWDSNWDFEPHRRAFETAMQRKVLTDLAVLLPIPKTKRLVAIGDYPTGLPLVNRKREEAEYRTGFTGTAVRERDAIEHIAGNPNKAVGGPLASALRTQTRGAMILLFASDPKSQRHLKSHKRGTADPRDVATLFSYALPYLADPTPKVGFTVRKVGAGAIVDA
ncbi:Z1 domain-containing protein [Gordonia terrae]|uniref:Z1 domain-containing protein n=1 Tax=Gordonia terrae TaxID=2055 RepID=UPI00200A64DC|nr:Z1 domain-containing protein [Gordonia terrae]UPW08127.1 Z1 domain-containing protein [Gordonia terrae]